MNQEKDECLMQSEQAIRSAPQSQIHKNKHAQTSAFVSAKTTFYTSSQHNTMVEKHKTIKCDLVLPPSIRTIKNQLLEERPLNSSCIKTEDNLHWFYGTIILGMKNGYGKLYVKTMYYYEGKFLANKKHGKGLLINENGHHYYGEFFADKIIGSNGLFEDFELKCSKNDKITLQKLEFPNGAIYEGQVLDGKRYGKGVYTWKDGTKYEGSFQDDQFHGLGVMTYADGRKYRGEWIRGQMEGIGEFTWPDSQEYRGQYKENKKHGFGIFKYKSGIKYTGHFENGLNHGTGVLTQPNCKPQISQWVNGERIE